MDESTTVLMEKIKAIEGGRGISYIVGRAYEILGNPAVIFDMDYTLIAAPETACDDRIWTEFHARGQLSRETIEFFKEESFIDDVANSELSDGVTYLISERLRYPRIFGQIWNGEHMPVADLCLIGSERPFNENSPALVRALCDRISREIADDPYYSAYGEAYQDSIITKLLSGAIDDRAIYSGHVANIYRGLDTTIYAVVAQCGAGGDPAELRDKLRRAQPACKCALYGGRVVIITSTKGPSPALRRGMSRLYGILRREGARAGVSAGFENLYELDRRYGEALSVMPDKDGEIAFFGAKH